MLKWDVSSVHSDFVGTEQGRLVVSGLGPARPIGEPYEQKGQNDIAWQWLQLDIGQKILAKRRLRPGIIPAANISRRDEKMQTAPQHAKGTQPRLFDISREKGMQPSASQGQALDLDQATKQAISSGFDPGVIGRMLLQFSERENGIELAMGFSAIIAKARRARIEQKRQR